MKTIFIFGDSITYGSWGRAGSGWTANLRNYLDQLEPYPSYYLYALGIPGETSAGLRARFEFEFKARMRSDDESYTVVLACGANDATWLNSENRFKVPVEDYLTNMQAVIQQAKAYTQDINVLTTTPVNETYSIEFKGKDKKCTNDFVNTYNTELKKLCATEQVKLIDVHSAFITSRIDEFLTEDGLHPNDEGHNKLSETIISQIFNS